MYRQAVRVACRFQLANVRERQDRVSWAKMILLKSDNQSPVEETLDPDNWRGFVILSHLRTLFNIRQQERAISSLLIDQ